jgi:hypothetical protein
MKIKKNIFRNFGNLIKNEFISYISFYKKNKLLFGLFLFIILLSFGFELTHFTLSIDEEYGILGGNQAKAWISQGRFGVAIIKKILHTSGVVPFWSTFLCVAFLFLAVTYFCSIIDSFLNKMNVSKNMRVFLLFIFGASFISFPTNAAYVSFSTYNFEVSVGILLTALSVKFFLNYILNKYRIIDLILCVLFLTYSVSIYQSFICLFLCSISFVSILSILNKNKIYFGIKNNFKILIRLFLVVVVSVVLYKIIDVLFSIKYPSMGYVEGFIRWGRRDFMENYLSIKRYYWSEIFNNKALFFYKISFISIALTSLVIFYNFLKIKVNKISYLFWCFLFFISPVLLTIALGCETPLRTMQSIAFLSGAILILIILSFKNKFIIFSLSFFSVLIIILQSQQISEIFSSDYSRYQQDIILANKIYNKISELKLGEKNEYPIVFTGRIRQEQIKQNIKMETLGYSFFEWDNGNPFRIYAFMKYLGYDLKSPNNDYLKVAMECQKDMPSWPVDGCMEVCDDILVVKLSEQ